MHQLQLMEEIIWDRGSTHNHANRLFWPQTERLYVFRKADGEYRASAIRRAWSIALTCLVNTPK